MTTMDQIHHIRQLFNEQGKSISEIARETGYNWKTVKKYVDMTDFNLPAPKLESERQFCPKLDPHKQVINQWLEDDKRAPRKQRHTAWTVFKRLKKESGEFNCSYRLVAEYVAAKKKELKLGKTEGFLPLDHRPGEAQADFGAAEFYESGGKNSGKYLVLSFPHSNAGFPQLNYGENMECLLEGLDAIFRHINGVPTEIWFDNASTMVTEIIKGGGRKLTDRFIRFCEHYGFKPVFMNPSAGWEKGNCENKVGYCRRNFMVPVPRFVLLSDYNASLLHEGDMDTFRDHYRYNATIKDLFAEDKANLLPLPLTPFDLSGTSIARTNGWGKFTINNGKHEYSVSPKYANTTVNLRLTSSTVTVMDGDMHEIVTHKRLYGDEKQQSMEWLPYLSYIALRPRSLRNTGIYDMMPEPMRMFLDTCTNTEIGKVLKVLSELTDRTGFDSAVQTVNQAIIYNTTDADSLKSLYRRLYSDIPELPNLKPQAELPEIEQMPTSLKLYDQFLRGGASNGKLQ